MRRLPLAVVFCVCCCSCAGRSDYHPESLPWNQSEAQFSAMVADAQRVALAGDTTATRDLVMLSTLTDGCTSETLGEAIASVWEQFCETRFFAALDHVPFPILDGLPGFILVARGESDAARMRSQVLHFKSLH